MAQKTAPKTKKKDVNIRDGVSLFSYMMSNAIYDIDLKDNTKGKANGWFTSGEHSGVISSKLTTALKAGGTPDLSNLKVGKFDTLDRETGKPAVGSMLYSASTVHNLGKISLSGDELSYERD
jgi:hypothetical protein